MLNSEEGVKEKEGKSIEGPGFCNLFVWNIVDWNKYFAEIKCFSSGTNCYKSFAPNLVFGIHIKILTNHLAKHNFRNVYATYEHIYLQLTF